MEKRHKWLLLLLLISWISFSSQRSLTDIPDSQLLQAAGNDNNVLSTWMSAVNFPANDLRLPRASLKLQDIIQDAELNNRDNKLKSIGDNADDIWTITAPSSWLGPRFLQLQQHHPRKRGFSMLSRWKPFNSMNRQRTSIRTINHALFPHPAPNDMVSAETRAYARPSGQPLRWG